MAVIFPSERCVTCGHTYDEHPEYYGLKPERRLSNCAQMNGDVRRNCAICDHGKAACPDPHPFVQALAYGRRQEIAARVAVVEQQEQDVRMDTFAQRFESLSEPERAYAIRRAFDVLRLAGILPPEAAENYAPRAEVSALQTDLDETLTYWWQHANVEVDATIGDALGRDEETRGELDNGAPALFRSDAEIAELDAAAKWNPSADQAAALATLRAAFERPGMYSLTGGAGRGKTTVSLALIRSLHPDNWDVLLLAPTWRAANRLTEVTGIRAVSLHRAIYGAPKLMRRCPCGEWSANLCTGVETMQEHEASINGKTERLLVPVVSYTCEHCQKTAPDVLLLPQQLRFEPRESESAKPYRLVVLDEASMSNTVDVRNALHKALLSTHEEGGVYGTRLLLMGDMNQLPPVERSTVPDPLGLLKPTAALTTVHRQKEGNPILDLALRHETIPDVKPMEWPFSRKEPGIEVTYAPMDAPANWAAYHRRANHDAVLICLSNATRAGLNARVRYLLGFDAACTSTGMPLAPGDRLLIRGNGAAVYNGEVWSVGSIRRVEPGTRLLDAQSRVPGGRRKYEAEQLFGRGAIGVWEAYISQGGEWQLVTLILPVGTNGLLESDLIRNGMKPDEARQLIREIARIWKDEAQVAYEARQAEWATARYAKLERDRTEPILLRAIERDDGRLTKSTVLALVDASQAPNREQVGEALYRAALAREPVDALLRQLDSPADIAAKHEGVEGYLVERYGAVATSSVIIADYGEALTAYAMQGAQAQYVGAVVDGAFWGAWHNDRLYAHQWMYSVVTRGQVLSIFWVKK